MGKVTNTLTSVITTSEDSTGVVPINRGNGNPAYDANCAEFTTYKNLTGTLILQLPATPIHQLYVKNIDPAGFMTVTWFPNGGANVLVAILGPGDLINLWSDPNNDSGLNEVTLDLKAGTDNCLCEFFIGG